MANSFLEKLKKGMGIEMPEEEVEEKTTKKRKAPGKKARKVVVNNPEETEEALDEKEEETKKLEVEEMPEEEQVKDEKSKKKAAKTKNRSVSPKINKKIVLKTKRMSPDEISDEQEDWLVPEGQLSVDVYQTKDELVIQSAIAGIKPDSLDISLEGDVVSIKGKREKPNNEEGDYFTKECYWGQFSREIILPVEVDPNRAKAAMKDGILIIRMPKIFREKKRKIMVKPLSE